MFNKFQSIIIYIFLILYSCSPSNSKLPLRKFGLHGPDNYVLGMTLSDARKLIKVKEEFRESEGLVIRTDEDIVLTFRKAKSNFPWVRSDLQLHSIFLDTVDAIPKENYRLVTLNRIEGLSDSDSLYNVKEISKISERYGLPVYNELETAVSYAPTPHNYSFIFPGDPACLLPSSVISITQYAPQNSYQTHLAGVSWYLRDLACIDSRPYFPKVWGSEPYVLDLEKSYLYRNKFDQAYDTLMINQTTTVYSLPNESSTPNFEVPIGALIKFEYRSKSKEQNGKPTWYYHNQVGFIKGNNLSALEEVDTSKILTLDKQEFKSFKEAAQSCNQFELKDIPEELQRKLSLFFKIHENQIYNAEILFDIKTSKYQLRDTGSGQLLTVEINSGENYIKKAGLSMIRMNWDFEIKTLEGECYEHSCEEIYACELKPFISVFDPNDLSKMTTKAESILLPRVFKR
ncbi:hypothetical protein [Leptospira interrogans]|nr:hypothetical protein [Leptospira interrogans]